jgi:hypothetical protein
MTTASMTILPTRAPLREATLYLAALDGWMRSARPTSDRVRVACVGLRTAIDRDEHRVAFTLSGIDRDAAQRWMDRLKFEVDALGPLGSAAVAWAAVACWGDCGRAPWTRFAESARRLAEALEPAGEGIACAKAAGHLRRVVK